ncbi:MAG: HD domain-containing protein [Chloroflexota bacterium]|nr:HD domain-containing protein [Chloroflexota bacterium]
MFERPLTRSEAELIEDMAEFIEAKHRGNEAHDYAHVLSVVNYAIRIAEAIDEEVDPFLLIAGAFFHDIGWVGTITGELHGLRGATIAEEYFRNTWVPREKIDQIKRIIVRHTHTSHIPPETAEERIVWDADGLAGLGLLGILRGIIVGKGSHLDILESTLLFAGKHFERLHFEESRRIDEELYEETQEIIEYFKEGLVQRKERIAELDLPVDREQRAELDAAVDKAQS